MMIGSMMGVGFDGGQRRVAQRMMMAMSVVYDGICSDKRL